MKTPQSEVELPIVDKDMHLNTVAQSEFRYWPKAVLLKLKL